MCIVCSGEDKYGAEPALIRELVAQRAEVDRPPLFNPEGHLKKDRAKTPLLMAIGTGSLQVAKVLVECRADVHYTDALGSTALNHCTVSNRDMMAWLKGFRPKIEYGVPVGGNKRPT